MLLLAQCLLAQPGGRVMVIGIDGLSIRGIKEAKVPNLRRLMDQGIFTLEARAVMPTVSSPNWASMLMGAGPEQHGITSNDWQWDKYEIAPGCKGSQGIFPSIVQVLQSAKPKLKLGAIYDWDGFGRLYEKGILHRDEHVLGSAKTAAAAKKYWHEAKPDFLFVHLDDVDHAGHEHAWESAKYLDEVARIDTLIGDLISAIDLGNSTVIVISDHGGTGTKHGAANMNDLLVPFIVAGKGAKERRVTPSVNVYDLAPTITALFGVPPHGCWIGKSAVTMSPRAKRND
jgi:predicted AlkP superfamily pyrophosphatase or phosphodiesterase